MYFQSIQLLATNYEECIDFYRRVLGLPFTVSCRKRSAQEVVFSLEEGGRLVVRPKAAMAAIIGTAHLEDLSDAQDGFALTFRVTQLEPTIRQIERQGGACSPIQAAKTPGHRLVHLRDPDGNLIELMDAPRW